MDYLIVNEQGIIENIIVIDNDNKDFASEIGATPYYEGAKIGSRYETLEERMSKENKLLKVQLKAISDRNDFIEDCMAEMTNEVYK